MKKLNFLVFIDDDNLTNRFHEIILKKADICGICGADAPICLFVR